jgi:tetratricopeptide (TPR) repeat protein
MSVHLARAQLLLQQSRPADAERELRLGLAHEPRSPELLALLALSLVELDRPADAVAAANDAVGLAPDIAYFHYIRGVVMHRLERHAEALLAARETVRLDPSNEDGFALLAAVHLSLREWSQALEAAENALALNPEHVHSANLRSVALVNLGRKAEAAETMDFALKRAPEDGYSHANQGWNYLHRNDPVKAQEHFREALRLEPDLEHARQGMLEALKARNPVYRGMLAYFLWMGRQGPKLQWAFVIGSLFLLRSVVAAAEKFPALWVAVVAFYLFIYLSWTAVPMFNLLLRFHPFGRFVLSADERKGSYWFGGFLLAALAMLVAELTIHGAFLIPFIVLAILSVCVAATFQRTGRNRMILALATGGLGAAAAGGIALLLLNNELGLVLFKVFSYGFLAFQFLASALQRK